ncbi:MAG: transglutaminase-like domain-containing protein [Oscillospiraceae bacterium]|nr:transglutaminase-like domain-containing protein [Oscillospiraceae bacterium]
MKNLWKIYLSAFAVFLALGLGLYWWTNHALFDYELTPVVILEGQPVTPDIFVPDTEKMQGVTVLFHEPQVQAAPGESTVSLKLERDLRSIDTDAKLYVLTPIKEITHEFGESAPPLRAADLISNANIAQGIPYDVSFTKQPLSLDKYAIGEHTLQLSLNGAPFEVNLIVADTKPPAATPLDLIVMIGDPVRPEDFVTDVFDHSLGAGLFISFVEEPNVFIGRSQIVQILIEDIYGNFDIFNASLSIKLNESSPTFTGLPAVIESTVDNTILYRVGVSAFDDFGRELEFSVDADNVDPFTVGAYTAIYKTGDLSGNVTSVEVPVYIVSINVEYVDNWVNYTLAQILRDGMTQLEQAQAIWKCVQNTVSYIDMRGGVKTVYEAAYHAITARRGDCYIFYSLSELLLTRAGIPNMRIERRDDRWYSSTHIWSLINPDELGWHHYDSSITTSIILRDQRYFFTQSQAEYITSNFRWGYYDYDPELYPDVVYE